MRLKLALAENQQANLNIMILKYISNCLLTLPLGYLIHTSVWSKQDSASLSFLVFPPPWEEHHHLLKLKRICNLKGHKLSLIPPSISYTQTISKICRSYLQNTLTSIYFCSCLRHCCQDHKHR